MNNISDELLENGLRERYKSFTRIERHCEQSAIYHVTNDLNEEYIVKIIESNYNKRELKLLKLDLPVFCIKLLDNFSIQNKFEYLVFNYYPLSLFTFLETQQPSFQTIKKWCKQLCYTLKKLHKMKIYHMDIKLENILLTERSENADCIICDFGISAKVGEEYSKYGYATDYFKAPEVDGSKNFHPKADIFSFGKVVELMIHFSYDKNEKDFFDKARKISGSEFQALCSFVKSCLTTDSLRRPTAKELLRHELFNNMVIVKPLDIDRINRFQIIQKMKFQRTSLKFSNAFYYFLNLGDFTLAKVLDNDRDFKIIKSCCINYILLSFQKMKNECINKLTPGHELIGLIVEKINQFETNDGDIIEVGNYEKNRFIDILSKYREIVNIEDNWEKFIMGFLEKAKKKL